MSNSTLSKLCTVLVPNVITQEELSSMSVKEKGTSMEAYVGAVYELKKFQMTKNVKCMMRDLLTEIDSQYPHSHYDGMYDSSRHNARSKLYEVMQIEWGQDLSKMLTFEMSKNSKFIATFRPPSKGTPLPFPHDLSSRPFPSKKDAAEELSREILIKLRDIEMKEALPTDTPW